MKSSLIKAIKIFLIILLAFLIYILFRKKGYIRYVYNLKHYDNNKYYLSNYNSYNDYVKYIDDFDKEIREGSIYKDTTLGNYIDWRMDFDNYVEPDYDALGYSYNDMIESEKYEGFDVITIGSMFPIENMEWLILDDDGERLLLVAKNVLKSFHLWEQYDDFEDAMYRELESISPSFGDYGRAVEPFVYDDSGKINFVNNITDEVKKGKRIYHLFNLSKNEINKYFGKMDKKGVNKKSAAKASITAERQGVLDSKKDAWYKGNAPYYLRDISGSGDTYKWIGIYGHIYDDLTNDEDYELIGLRPAVFVNKSKLNHIFNKNEYYRMGKIEHIIRYNKYKNLGQ